MLNDAQSGGRDRLPHRRLNDLVEFPHAGSRECFAQGSPPPQRMSLMILSELRQFMNQQRIGGWLVYDFRSSNPTLARLLPVDPRSGSGKRFLTRRAALWIPARPDGSPGSGGVRLLCHGIDRGQFEHATLPGGEPVAIDQYLSWEDFRAWMHARVQECQGPLAMEYSPGAALPVIGIVDAGTIELVRSAGAEIVSSADLVQVAIARWNAAALESHEWASREVARIKDEAFDFIRTRRASGDRVTEYDVHQLILSRFSDAGLETPDGPIVAVNEHGADPHFEVSAASPSPIRAGDWILLDLWARRPGDQHVFSDITWVAYAGERVPERNARAYAAVKAARDAAVALARARHAAQKPVEGWELDDAARAQIVRAGYEPFIRHRTGHSLSPGPMVHGVGVNIDNLETHDRRRILPGIGFTIEPGVYIPSGPDGPGFGIRLEINVFVDPATGPRVTSCIQDQVVLV